MKDIIINRPMAFAACQLAQSNDKEKSYITGVYIEPSGRVSGTNGHFAVICDDDVEPFDGDPITLRAKALSIRQASECDAIIAFDSETTAMIICEDATIIKTKLPRTILTADILKGNYPDVNEVIPKYSHDDSLSMISFNASYVAEISKRFDPYTSAVKFRMKDSDSPIEVTFGGFYSKGVTMYLMPIRL